MKKPMAILLVFVAVAPLLMAGCGRLRGTGQVRGYTPQVGDLVFQSLPPDPLVKAIEGATGSKYSHCGIVVRSGDGWGVMEAIGPVKDTPLDAWASRSPTGDFDVYRLRLPPERIGRFVEAARQFHGRPYDIRYRMDDEYIYCSELIYKAYSSAFGEELAPLVRLGDLNWEPFVQLIQEIEGGEPPLDRMMITPVAITRSEKVEPVRVGALKN